jgi:small subunit ribosomal protein S16
MLIIRLARTGKKKQAHFRLIISEKTKDTHGDYLEALGHMDPHANPRKVVLETDRIKYWLSKGAQVSPSVHNIFVEQGIIKADKLRVWKPKAKKAAEGEAK